jgi:Notch-like protein
MVGLRSAVGDLVQRNAADPAELQQMLGQFNLEQTCENTLTFLRATDTNGGSPLLQGMGLDISELDDCNTFLGVGYMILDFCPLFCNQCTQAELEDVADASVNIKSDGYSCSCRPGWSGDNCDVDDNECGSEPCRNGGTCDDLLDSYACSCTNGYAGTNCADDIDECELNPCLNGAVCTDLVHSFECACADGWAPSGVSSLEDLVNGVALICSENVDECLSNPCLHGATCVDGVFEYLCICSPNGWSGENCDADVDECGSDPCLHGGVCSDSNTVGATIGTEDDYWNTVADIDVEPYAYACKCIGGWEGENCADDIDECASNPCQNGGLCVDELDTYGCFCADGFRNPAGTQDQDCSTEVDPCTFEEDDCDKGFVRDQPDQPVTTCAQTGPGEHECTCYPGYSTENSGVVCTEIDECGANLCQNGAACADLVFDYACTCMDGYTDSDCETEIAECVSSPCKNGATCIDLAEEPSLEIEGGVIGPDYYNCRCTDGWDGHNCDSDINECDSSPCQNGSECNEEIDVFACACLEGFSGFLCEVDDDECTSQPCKNQAICQDSNDFFVQYKNMNSTDQDAISILRDAYHCTCQAGFSGGNCEVNIQECDSSPCQNGAACTDGIPEYVCTCMDGYSGDNCATDNDECLSFPCKNGATCTTPGVFMYECTCVTGWTGVTDCDEDIDECGSGPCKNGATCTESSGSLGFDNAAFVVYVPNDAYHCECADGWEGENCEVNSNECASEPCQNGAECVDLIFSFTCTCVAGFDSFLCDVEVEPCERSTDDCDPINAQCHHDGPGLHSCTCNPGWETEVTVPATVEGTSCTDFDECASNPCMNGAGCEHDIDLGHPGTTWYQCTCLPGFTGDQCEQDINECDSRPCQFGSGCRESTTNCVEDPDQLLVLMASMINGASLTSAQLAKAQAMAPAGGDCDSVLGALADPSNADVVALLGMTAGSRYSAPTQHCDTPLGEMLVRDVCPVACRTCSCPQSWVNPDDGTDDSPESCETTNDQRTKYCMLAPGPLSGVPGGDANGDGCVADYNDDQTVGLDSDCQYTPAGGGTLVEGVHRGLNQGQFKISDLGVSFNSNNHKSASMGSTGGGLSSPGRAFMKWMDEGTNDDGTYSDGWLLIGSGSDTTLDSFILEPISALDAGRDPQTPFGDSTVNLRGNQHMAALGGGDAESQEYLFYAPNTRDWLTDPELADRPSGTPNLQSLGYMTADTMERKGGSVQLDQMDTWHFERIEDRQYNGMNWRLGANTAELEESGGSYMRFFSQEEVDANPSLIVSQQEILAVDGGFMFSVCNGCMDGATSGFYGYLDGGRNAVYTSEYYLDQVVYKHIMYLTSEEVAQMAGPEAPTPTCTVDDILADITGPHAYVCSCSDGWSGTNCSEEINECSSNPCNEWDRAASPSTCTHGVDVYFCSCSPGFTGYNCEVENNECESQPCQNNGECEDDVFLYSCQCVAGYSGYNCAEDIDE